MSEQEFGDLGRRRTASRCEALRVEAATDELTEELSERARGLDIEGRSQMSKRRLASAARTRQG